MQSYREVDLGLRSRITRPVSETNNKDTHRKKPRRIIRKKSSTEATRLWFGESHNFRIPDFPLIIFS